MLPWSYIYEHSYHLKLHNKSLNFKDSMSLSSTIFPTKAICQIKTLILIPVSAWVWVLLLWYKKRKENKQTNKNPTTTTEVGLFSPPVIVQNKENPRQELKAETAAETTEHYITDLLLDSCLIAIFKTHSTLSLGATSHTVMFLYSFPHQLQSRICSPRFPQTSLIGVITELRFLLSRCL